MKKENHEYFKFIKGILDSGINIEYDENKATIHLSRNVILKQGLDVFLEEARKNAESHYQGSIIKYLVPLAGLFL